MTRRPTRFERVLVPGLLLGIGMIPPTTWAAAPDGSPGIDGVDQTVPSGPLVGNPGGVGGTGSAGAAGSEAGGTGGFGGRGGFVTTANSGNAVGGSGGTGGIGGQGGPAANVNGSTITNSTSISGGVGGTGGIGGKGGDGTAFTTGNGFGALGGDGGVGGTGGPGITASGGATVINTATISGGTGGRGGAGGPGGNAVVGGPNPASAFGGVGGDGGIGGNGGAGISGSNSTIINSGTISGGTSGSISAGGHGGSAVAVNSGFADQGPDGFGGPPGLSGGAGITGSNLTIINSGSISGGLTGVLRASAVAFTGGINVLEMQSGSTITGNVTAFSAADSLRLGGAVNASFNTSLIGPAAQFQNFGIFEKTGSGTWTLTNAPGQTTSWTITQGTLAVANVASLGGGSLSFNGGMLQATGTLALTNPITINAGGSTIDSNGNNVTVSSAISGVGGLTKNGAGELRLQAAGTYGGGTTVNAGTLVLDSVGGSLPVGGALTVNGGLFDMSQISTGQTVGALAGSGGQIDLGSNNLTTNSNSNTTLATQITGAAGGGGLIKQGSGILTLTGLNLYSGGTTIQGGLINFASALNLGSGPITLNGGGLQWATGNTTDISFQLASLGAGGGIFDTNGNNVALSQTISGAGGLTKQGQGTLTLAGNNLYSGATTVTGGLINFTSTNNFGSGQITLSGGGLQWATGSTADISSKLAPLGAGGGTFDTNGNTVTLASAITGSGGLTKQGLGVLTLAGNNSYSGGTTVSAGTLVGNSSSLQGNILNNASVVFNQSGAGIYAGTMAGSGSLTLQGGGLLNLTGTNTYTGGTSVSGGLINFNSANNFGTGAITLAGGGLQWAAGTTTDISSRLVLAGTNATFDTNGNNVTFASALGGTGGITKAGNGILTLGATNTYSGGTTVSGGLINFNSANNFGTGPITLAGGGLQWAAGTTTDISSRLVLAATNATFDTNGNNITFASALSGTGGITKAGNGILTLGATNTYSGGTTVTGGLINFNSAGNFGSGQVTLNGGGLQWAAGSTTDISAKLAPLGAGGGTFDTNGNNVTLASAIGGAGGLTKQGTGLLNLTGNNSFTGGTTVSAGTLAVNGSLASGVTVGPGATLGGNGTITGLVTNNGIIAPGNSIGTLNIVGSFVQAAGGTYQVEVNNGGQGDRINATGTATLQGGTVQVLAAAGSYANSTTYTIVRATGGVSGTYSGVTSNFAFLTPTLSYDANDVFLTLALPTQNAFTPSFLALTPNQKAVGTALNQSFANAGGDFATVIGALAGLNIVQGPLALDTISGQPWADFGTMNTNSSALFMNALGQQMANARGAASAGQRQALAQACEIEACDAVGPLSAWFSALGGLGSVLGDTNASTLTYNFGGAAAGIDYRIDPRFLVGLGVGYTHGTQWVNSFLGQGWSDSVSVAAYGSFTQGGFYLDALAGYAYFNNQLQRQILIPGLQQRTATGSTGANQFLGQIEGGYKLGVYAPAAATITPFGRFQISSVTQNAFSESGAQSLSLNVAQQTTNSLRTTIGADLGSSIGLGNERKLDLAVRLGWMHEFADVARPITAAFAGAPGNSFTVFGATPLRNAAVVGLQATTKIAAATQIYLRYDGEIATGTDNHALNVGLRMSW